MGWGHLLFRFDGRIGRARFWQAYLVVVAAVVVVAGIAAGNRSALTDTLLVLVALGSFWCSMAIYVKRYHDRGKSGWWVLIALIPVIGAVWLTVELGFIKGESGPNEYGPDPLGA